MISYQVDYDDKKVAAMFKTLADDMPEINRRILGLLADEVTTRSQERYLSGGHPLFRRTGKLAQSVGEGIHVYEDYAVVGTNISYGAYHEFGYHGPVQVRDFVRHRGKSLYPYPVRGHTRNVNYAGRPFLRPALDDIFQSGRAVAVIEGALKEEIEKRATA